MVKILRKLRHRWLEKFISLILAIILWLYVSERNKPEKYITVPLKLKNIPVGTAIASQYKNIVLLKIKGRETVIQTLSSRDFKAYIDLKNASLGKNVLPVIIKSPKSTRRFKIVKVEPQNVKILLDKLAHKEVPVSPTIINSPADGYIKSGEIVVPEKIVIKGPLSFIETIDVIRTKPIDIGGVSGSIYKEVEFDMPNEFVSPVDYKTARVTIKIVKNFKTKIYRNIQIRIIGLRNEFYVKNTDELIAIAKIYGPPSKLKILETNKRFLYIDLSDIDDDGKYEKPVRAQLPKDCSVIYIKPSKIELKIKEK